MARQPASLLRGLAGGLGGVPPNETARAQARSAPREDRAFGLGVRGAVPPDENGLSFSREAPPAKTLPFVNAYLRSWRAMTMRWIWLVPS
ncbi:hypothetical protein GCM10009734_45770 [Nonomuraea bangladeshensis]